jgi:hypothetical protein
MWMLVLMGTLEGDVCDFMHCQWCKCQYQWMGDHWNSPCCLFPVFWQCKRWLGVVPWWRCRTLPCMHMTCTAKHSFVTWWLGVPPWQRCGGHCHACIWIAPSNIALDTDLGLLHTSGEIAMCTAVSAPSNPARPAYIIPAACYLYVILQSNMPKGCTCTVIGHVTQMTTVRSQTVRGPRVHHVPVWWSPQSTPKHKKAKQMPPELFQMLDDLHHDHPSFIADMDLPSSKMTCICFLFLYNAHMTYRHCKTILRSGCHVFASSAVQWSSPFI